jgi:tetratricopeptide (TPR) repeat protein
MLPTAVIAVLALLQPWDDTPKAVFRQPPAVRSQFIWAEQLRCEGVERRNSGRLLEALAAFDAAARLCPQHADVFAGRGKTLALLRRHDDAADDYERLIALDPHSWWNWHWVAEGWIIRGKYDEAQQCFDHAAELRPTPKSRCDVRLAEMFCWLGLDLAGNGGRTLKGEFAPGVVEPLSWERVNRAENAVMQALLLEADGTRTPRAKLFGYRGVLRHGSGRTAAAVADYDTVLAEMPDDSSLHYWRAQLAAKQRDTAKAVHHLELAEKHGLGRVWALSLRVDLHRDAGEWERVEACVAECRTIIPDDISTLRTHGCLHRYFGRDDEADRAARRVVQLSGTTWGVEVVLQAWSLRHEFSDREAADRLLTRVLDTGGLTIPDRTDLLLNRGKWRCESGPTEEGYEDMTRAVRLAPASVMFRIERSKQAVFMKRYADAMEDAEAVCRLWPHDPMVWELLREARQVEQLAAAFAGRKPDFRPAGPVVRVPVGVAPGANLVAALPDLRRHPATRPPAP